MKMTKDNLTLQRNAKRLAWILSEHSNNDRTIRLLSASNCLYYKRQQLSQDMQDLYKYITMLEAEIETEE